VVLRYNWSGRFPMVLRIPSTTHVLLRVLAGAAANLDVRSVKGHELCHSGRNQCRQHRCLLHGPETRAVASKTVTRRMTLNPLLQDHQYPHHFTVIARVLGQALVDQRGDERRTHYRAG